MKDTISSGLDLLATGLRPYVAAAFRSADRQKPDWFAGATTCSNCQGKIEVVDAARSSVNCLTRDLKAGRLSRHIGPHVFDLLTNW